MESKRELPPGFDDPTRLPDDVNEQEVWQSANQQWWESHPMRYDWNEEVHAQEFSREFFEEIDRRFFHDAAQYLPPNQLPFDKLLPYSALHEMDVLEVGVGNGSHAQLIAPCSRSFTGIDLTRYAVESTQRRFAVFGLNGRILQMDAERLTFPDNSFDFIWTWGVIHHSANTEQILSEMSRVLRPRGKAIVMVYHRSFLYYYLFNGFFRGIVCGGLAKAPSLHELVQRNTDGAIARVYTTVEWQSLVEKYFNVEDIFIKGQKSELFPLPAGNAKDLLMKLLPNAASRFVLNTCRQGSFLISRLQSQKEN